MPTGWCGTRFRRHSAHAAGLQVWEVSLNPGVGIARGHPAGETNIGRSNGAADNGTVTSSGIKCGVVWAKGKDVNKRAVIWTPAFNSGPVKLVTRYFIGGDTDGDGLADDVEITVRCTNPAVADTDGGGINDGTEITNGTNLCPLPTTTISTIATATVCWTAQRSPPGPRIRSFRTPTATV